MSRLSRQSGLTDEMVLQADDNTAAQPRRDDAASKLDEFLQIGARTYERKDIGEQRLGLIVQVGFAPEQFAIDNVVNRKLCKDGQYFVLDYSRLVALLIPAVNTLAKRVEYVESVINWNSR